MTARAAMNGQSPRGPVVVTGGAGYIGSLLVRQLLDQGHRVRILDCLLYGDGAIEGILSHPSCELIVGDFRDAATVDDVLDGASAVIHLGAIVGDPACAIDEERTLSTNVHATELIADACKAHGVSRMVFASTCSVYGASLDPLDESSVLNPVSLYANSKIAAERILIERKSSSFDPVILRFGTAYGASARYRFDLVVNLLTAKAVRDGRITIHGGDQWRPFIHAFDIARAVILALGAPREDVSGEIINVGVDAQNYRLGKVGEIIQNLVPGAEIVIDHEVTDRRNYYVHFEKARQLLGFSPTRTVEDGVGELVDALNLNIVHDYHDSHYHNVLALAEGFSESREGSRVVAADRN